MPRNVDALMVNMWKEIHALVVVAFLDAWTVSIIKHVHDAKMAMTGNKIGNCLMGDLASKTIY